jgi:folate-binding protein YgfZ
MLDVVAAEDAFARSVAVVATRGDVVEVAGPEAGGYLQGQLSQDVERLMVGSSTQSLLLQPQGKIDAWIRVTRRDHERFWLDVDAGFGPIVDERLKRFKIRVKADVTLMADLDLLAVRGPDAAQGPLALGLLVPDGAGVLDWAAGAARGAPAGFDVVGSQPPVPPDVPVAPVEALEAWRIRWGLPAMGRELDASTIPASAGIVEMSVSFTKGCYVGQELVARIDSRGATTPTRLRGIRFVGPVEVEVDLGATIVVGDEQVGRVTSFAPRSQLGPIGLGYCRRTVTVPSAAAVLDRAGRRAPVEIVEVPLG